MVALHYVNFKPKWAAQTERFFVFNDAYLTMHDTMYGSIKRESADWRVIKSLLPYLLQFKTRVAFALALLIAAKVSNVWVPITLKHIIDYLDATINSVTPTQAALMLPIGWLLTYGILRFSSVLFGELRDAIFGRVAERTVTTVGLNVFEHLHKLDLEFHLSRKTGGLSRDIERGTSGVRFLLRAVVFSIVPILLEVGMVIGILFIQFDILFAAITLTAIIVYILYSVWVTEWRTELVRTANQKDSQANARAIDSLLNFETVKYFNNEHYEYQRYALSLAEYEHSKVKNHLSLAALNIGQAFIISASILAIMFLASSHTLKGQMTLGDLAMINAFMIQVFIPLNALGFIYREIKRSLADTENLFSLLKIKPAISDKPNAHELAPTADGISFENVSFAYQTTRPILKDLSFTIAPGETVAIVGPSGSGKSTITRLLLRFYEAQHGNIKIGGQDIRDLTQDSVRSVLGVVPQEAVLFNDTLYENIRYGYPKASHEEIEHATTLSYLHTFIKALPDGYQTKVGERGLKVSGGEKQRIAIARTILKAPRIFIFDEATSSLDSASEQAILNALTSIAQNHTTLVIAHRLSTIVHSDRILVLKDGTIAEQGDHEALLQKKGVYAELWALQQMPEQC